MTTDDDDTWDASGYQYHVFIYHQIPGYQDFPIHIHQTSASLSGFIGTNGSNGGFHNWGYPKKWMVYSGNSHLNIDDVGVPPISGHLMKPPRSICNFTASWMIGTSLATAKSTWSSLTPPTTTPASRATWTGPWPCLTRLGEESLRCW